MSGIPQQRVLSGWQLPLVPNWPASGDNPTFGSLFDDFNSQKFSGMNWQVMDYDLLSIFRNNIYAYENYLAMSGNLGYLRKDPDLAEAIFAFQGGNRNAYIDPMTGWGPPYYGEGFAFEPIQPRHTTYSALTQLWYYYDDLFESGWYADFLTHGTGTDTYFNLRHSATGIFARHPIRWGFLDNRIDDSGNVRNYISHVEKVLAFPFCEWPSKFIPTDNVPDYTGDLMELRYSNRWAIIPGGNAADNSILVTGCYGNLAVPTSGFVFNGSQDFVASDERPMVVTTGDFMSFGNNAGTNAQAGNPLRVYNGDAVKIPLNTVGTTVADAVSGWNYMLNNPRANAFHPSWPWIYGPNLWNDTGNAASIDGTPTGYIVLPFKKLTNYWVDDRGIFVGSTPINTGYINDWYWLTKNTGNYPVSPLFSGIPIPAVDPSISFQLNNLNLKPTAFVDNQGWPTGTTITYHSGMLTEDLIHQLNTVPTFFYNIFAKQKTNYQDFSNVPLHNVFLNGTSRVASGVKIPEMQWLGAKLFFGSLVPKDVSIDISLNAEEFTIPATLTIFARSGTPLNDDFGNFSTGILLSITDDIRVVPTCNYTVQHFRQDGTYIQCGDRSIYPPVVLGVPQYDFFGNYNGDLSQPKTMPHNKTIFFDKNSNCYLYQAQLSDANPPPNRCDVASGNPLVSTFRTSWLAGVNESGNITNDQFRTANGSGVNPFYGFYGYHLGLSTNDNTFTMIDPDLARSRFYISCLQVLTGWRWYRSDKFSNYINELGLGSDRIQSYTIQSFEVESDTVGPLWVDGSITIDGVNIPYIDLPGIPFPTGPLTSLNENMFFGVQF